MKIQTNSSGTRSMDITDQHLQTIEKYQLFRDLIDSNGYVDEQVLDKLKLNIRSLLSGDAGKDKDLLALVTYISADERAEKVMENQSVIRQPIVRNGRQATVGYAPDVWKTWQ